MTSLDELIHKGHYAKKQIFCKDWLISWSHARRFLLGLELAREFSRKRILDYGCGDGTFLSMLMTSAFAPSEAVGAEVHESLVADCAARLQRPGLSFVLIKVLDTPRQFGSYDGVICMEVLEHVVEPDALLDRLSRLLKPQGRLIISVPVEIGLPLLVKQAVRRIAGWRGLGDYPGQTPYTLRELFTGVFAGSRQHMIRPVFQHEDGNSFHDHKGFNWMGLRDVLAQRFRVERIIGSPCKWLPPQLASQVWFLLRKPA